MTTDAFKVSVYLVWKAFAEKREKPKRLYFTCSLINIFLFTILSVFTVINGSLSNYCVNYIWVGDNDRTEGTPVCSIV